MKDTLILTVKIEKPEIKKILDAGYDLFIVIGTEVSFYSLDTWKEEKKIEVPASKSGTGTRQAMIEGIISLMDKGFYPTVSLIDVKADPENVQKIKARFSSVIMNKRYFSDMEITVWGSIEYRVINKNIDKKYFNTVYEKFEFFRDELSVEVSEIIDNHRKMISAQKRAKKEEKKVSPPVAKDLPIVAGYENF